MNYDKTNEAWASTGILPGKEKRPQKGQKAPKTLKLKDPQNVMILPIQFPLQSPFPHLWTSMNDGRMVAD